jgi:hypothetical protein
MLAAVAGTWVRLDDVFWPLDLPSCGPLADD